MNSLPLTRFPENFGRRSIAFWLLLLCALIAVTAYFTMLTGFTPYEDESTLMLSVKQYLGGKRLYQDIFTIFGPYYYFYNGSVRTLTATPVNHDVTRVTSIFPWVVCGLLSAFVTLRLTRSLLLAALTLSLASLMVAFFHAEPGHTHELTLVLLVGFVACPLSRYLAARRWLLMSAMGALGGALLLLKVNIGIMALAALALALVAHSKSAPVWRYVVGVVGAGFVLIPAALMQSRLEARWAQIYCVLATTSVAATVVCLLRCRRRGIASIKDALQIAGGGALVVALALGVLAIQGVSVSTVFNNLLLQPARVGFAGRNWFYPPPFSSAWILWALLGLGLALYTAKIRPGPNSSQERWLLVLKCLLAAASLVAIRFHVDLFLFVAPFAWLVLFNPDPAERKSQEFPRTVLCSVAVVHTLYGYPVYGSQGKVIQLLLLIVVMVYAGDSLTLIEFAGRRDWLARYGRVLATLALAAIAVLNCRTCFYRYVAYRELPALDLPGAHRLHVEASQKAQFTSLVSQITHSCDVFEGLPGLPSLNFWTGIEPVTGLNWHAWTIYLSPEQQTVMIRALSTHPRACIVYNPVLAAAWNPGGKQDLESLPLVQYIRHSFKPVISNGDYRILIRNERPWPPQEIE